MAVNVFKYLKVNSRPRRLALLNYVFKQRTKKEELTYEVYSNELANELSDFLSDVDMAAEFPDRLYISLNADGFSVIAEAETDDGKQVIEVYCNHAGKIENFDTGF